MTLTLGSMLLACSSNSNVLSVLPSSTNTNSQSSEGQPLRVTDKASCIAETLAASLYTGMTTEISGRVCFLFSLQGNETSWTSENACLRDSDPPRQSWQIRADAVYSRISARESAGYILHQKQRAPAYLVAHAPKIFPQHPQYEELQAAQYHDKDDDRGPSLDRAPVDQGVDC